MTSRSSVSQVRLLIAVQEEQRMHMHVCGCIVQSLVITFIALCYSLHSTSHNLQDLCKASRLLDPLHLGSTATAFVRPQGLLLQGASGLQGRG